MSEERLKLAIPRENKLYGPTVDLLSSCGVPVAWGSERRYTAHMPALPGVDVVTTRGDATYQAIEQGGVDLGILGMDQFLEVRQQNSNSIVILEDLGFGDCELWVAVPETWTDVNCIDDLTVMSKNKIVLPYQNLRIATKYPKLVQNFLNSKGLTTASLVHATGTLETFPDLGLADLIADIVSSGNTLRENRLKQLDDGYIQTFQACLIGNRDTLRSSAVKLASTRAVLERLEAYLRAKNSYTIIANVPGTSPEAVAQHVMQHPELGGMRGPTIAPVYSNSTDELSWFAVTLVVQRTQLLEVVDHLRDIGGDDFIVDEAPYIFRAKSESYAKLLDLLR